MPKPQPSASSRPALVGTDDRPRYVLVWGNAFVYATQSLNDGVRFSGAERAASEVWPAEILEDLGEVVKIRTLGSRDVGHCFRSPSAIGAVELELFVKEADLAPVITEPTTVTFDDGTWVSALPGVAVTEPKEAPREKTRFAIDDGIAVPIGLQGKIGDRYLATPRFETKDAHKTAMGVLYLKGGVEVRAGRGGTPTYSVLRSHPQGEGVVAASWSALASHALVSPVTQLRYFEVFERLGRGGIRVA